MESALPGSTVLQGLAVRGKTAQEDAEQTKMLVDDWLEGLGMKKANTEEAAVLAAYDLDDEEQKIMVSGRKRLLY